MKYDIGYINACIKSMILFENHGFSNDDLNLHILVQTLSDHYAKLTMIAVEKNGF